MEKVLVLNWKIRAVLATSTYSSKKGTCIGWVHCNSTWPLACTYLRPAATSHMIFVWRLVPSPGKSRDTHNKKQMCFQAQTPGGRVECHSPFIGH